jgi:acetylglutamate kinase
MWLNSRPVYIKSSPAVVTVVDTKVTRAESLREVDEIRTGVVGLIRELDQLLREADLLDARRDADALELRFAPRTVLNDF